MRAGGIKSPPVLDELESHLREDVEEQVRSGLGVSAAFTAGVERLGPATALKIEFETIGVLKESRTGKNFWRASVMGAVFFGLGAALCYVAVLPLAWSASAQYAAGLGLETPPGRNTAFVSFAAKLMFGFGAAFALPMGMLTLVKNGILEYRKLAVARRYVIVFNLVLGALLTTPEVVTQLLLFIPLQLIYEAGVWLAGRAQRKEQHV